MRNCKTPSRSRALQSFGILLWILWIGTPSAFSQTARFWDETVHSSSLGANRVIHVHLPPSYDANPKRRYPVLYLEDGQNVFSTAGTNVAFGWGNWALDQTADRLYRAGRMQEIIMVAVDNTSARYQEYCGRMNPPSTNGAVPPSATAFEKYSAFLITELKPLIDREYRTKTSAANTGIMGSSLGRLCSIVISWEHPETFGLAASLSGSFQVEHTNFLNSVLRDYRGKPKPVRVYLDSGVTDFMGGDDNCSLTGQVAAELR